MRCDDIKFLMNQKALKDSYTGSKDPKTLAMTLVLTSSASAFTNMQTILGNMWELTGVSLA